jgi:hypothetical protein
VSAERRFVTRTLRNGETDDGAFDRTFWQELGAEAVFAAAWEMVDEALSAEGAESR